MAEHTAIILTEGETDDAFFRKLIADRSLSDIFKIVPRVKNEAGQGAFQKRLLALKDPREIKGIKVIIIVGDNDGNPSTSFKSIKKQITRVGGYIAPEKLRTCSQRGSHREPADLPGISVLMLPWDREKGCLETLLLRAFNKKYKKQMECVNKLSKCVKTGNWPISKRSKMMMRCLLSSVCKSEPNTPLTRAWSTDSGRPGDIFPLSSPAFDQITEFLHKMGQA